MILPWPSESNGKTTYYIDTDNRTCSCPAFMLSRKRGEPCKHLIKAEAMGVFTPQPRIQTVDLPEPSTVPCRLCKKPLTNIVEVAGKIHGRCLVLLFGASRNARV